VAELRYSPAFVQKGASLSNVLAEQRYINGLVHGIAAESLDILYEMDGEMMPPIRNWPLDSAALLHLGPLDRSGTYHILGIRDSREPDPDLWISVEARIRIANN
jgi:hypothetical protein